MISEERELQSIVSEVADMKAVIDAKRLSLRDLDERCNGCKHGSDSGCFAQCRVFVYPARKWALPGGCPMASHTRPLTSAKAKPLNPIKASKRANKK